ncbi:MAG: hypothetical protein ACI8WB_005848 [Phenylobacterium sp.]|jgi:hypothetical protein
MFIGSRNFMVHSNSDCSLTVRDGEQLNLACQHTVTCPVVKPFPKEGDTQTLLEHSPFNNTFLLSKWCQHHSFHRQ